MSYDDILVPTDGSEGAEVAVAHAAEIAEKFGSKVHLIYVIDVRVSSTSELITNVMGQFQEIGETALESISDEFHRRDIDTVAEMTEGVPHQEINEYAEENDVDLIVMGTHGRTGLDRVLVGSTTEKLVRTCEIPIMTVDRPES